MSTLSDPNPSLGAPPHGLAGLLEAMQREYHVPSMSLADALEQLAMLDRPALDGLVAQDSDLLGRRCTELVTRGLLTREQLGQALARMSGLPHLEFLDLEQAPPAFVAILFPEHSTPPPPAPAPACNFEELGDALEDLQRQPIVSLRQALLDLHLLDAPTLEQIEAQDPHMLRDRHPLLVRRALLTEDELGRALARAAGIPEVDALRFDLSGHVFDRMPAPMARARRVLPLGQRGDAFFVASCTPTDEQLRRDLAGAIDATVVLVWADSAAILERVQREERGRIDAALRLDTVEWKPPGAAEQRLDPDEHYSGLHELVAIAATEVAAVHEDEATGAVGERSGMARLVRHMLLDARKAGASDIHIESLPADHATLVRMRVDGDLRPYVTLPPSLRAALVSRIKVMARLDIAEHRRPQDGKILLHEFGGDKIEIRVAVLPTHDGMENVVLRLLGQARPLPLASLGLQPRDQAIVERLSAHSFGLVLAAGPTGSGKTTTLHSMLMQVNTAARKIWTVEDPIEITQEGLNQVQVNARIGLTFATAMRSFLRADPDIIMVGEIRDAETAKIAIDASLTGHLVLSTLHTNNAAESVMRLLDLGLDPINFADSLLGVLAQRLVRSLCPHCRTSVLLDDESRQALLAEYTAGSRLTPQEGERRLLEAAGVDVPQLLRIGVARGCAHCAGKGYKGRMGVFEILENGPAVRELVRRNASPAEILDAAVDAGMRSLRHDALEKAVQGRIDLLQARIAYL
jgi:type II secretory ATPase GspE/PulE/Tfp pilus assembly ATPase PilB-like protein